MFLEDEREATGIQEDVYYKKKPSLLLLDPKSQVLVPYYQGLSCVDDPKDIFQIRIQVQILR
jgi:hypothetical protein